MPASYYVACTVLALLLFGRWYEEGRASSSSTDFLMNTFVSQTVYGPHREEAITAVHIAEAIQYRSFQIGRN